jgi:hypothetical protein
MRVSVTMQPVLFCLAFILAPPEAPLPALRVEAMPAGSILHIRNAHTAPLSAFLVRMVDYPGGRFEYFHDNVHGEAIAPGTERHFEVRSMLAGVAPDYLKLQAAIYADGSTAGGAGEVAELIASRRERLRAFREAIQLLDAAKRKGQSAEQVIAELEKWRLSPAYQVLFVTIRRLREEGLDRALEHLAEAERALTVSKPPLGN